MAILIGLRKTDGGKGKRTECSLKILLECAQGVERVPNTQGRVSPALPRLTHGHIHRVIHLQQTVSKHPPSLSTGAWTKTNSIQCEPFLPPTCENGTDWKHQVVGSYSIGAFGNTAASSLRAVPTLSALLTDNTFPKLILCLPQTTSFTLTDPHPV